ncbi:MAG: hypothetical protein ACRBDI_00955 [Alphaproteobacteria bacterium]
MSSIRSALEKLDRAVGVLDSSILHAEEAFESKYQENVIDVDFVSKRLDRAIASVESLLEEKGQ